MKKTMKVVSLLLTVVMIATLAFVSFAAGSFTVSAGSATAEARAEVTISIELSNNPGVSVFNVNIGYDAQVMRLKSATAGDVVNSFSNSDLNTEENPITIKCFMNPAKSEEDKDLSHNKSNGVMATLTFVISEDAKAGSYPIEVSIARSIDVDLNKVECTAKSGVITIEDETATEKGTATAPVTTTEKETTTVPETSTEKETTTVPETSTEKETTTVPETSTEKETTTVPETTTEKETTTVPETTSKDDTEEPTTDDGIPDTGDSNVIALIAGVCVLSATAFVATRKRNND